MMKTKPYPVGTNLPNFVNFFKSITDENHHYSIISSIDYPKNKNGLCFPTFESFKAFVISNIKEGNLLVLENVDYGGHYKIVLGYDSVNDNYEEDMLIFADSSDLNDGAKDGVGVFPADRFFYMWFDHHCLSSKYRLQPFAVIKRIDN